MAKQSSKKSKRPRNEVSLQTWITRDLKLRIERAAIQENISESAYVRRILENMVPGGA